ALQEIPRRRHLVDGLEAVGERAVGARLPHARGGAQAGVLPHAFDAADAKATWSSVQASAQGSPGATVPSSRTRPGRRPLQRTSIRLSRGVTTRAVTFRP